MDAKTLERLLAGIEVFLVEAKEGFSRGRFKSVSLKLELRPGDLRFADGSYRLVPCSLTKIPCPPVQAMTEEHLVFWKTKIRDYMVSVYGKSVSLRPNFIDIVIYPGEVAFHERRESKFVNEVSRSGKTIRLG